MSRKMKLKILVKMERRNSFRRTLKRGRRMNLHIVILYVIVICEMIIINKLSNDLSLLWHKFDKMHRKNQKMMGVIEEI